ncbi:MAG: cyclic nucleotide-binding domain-containing protein [Proteobacteria bacterium]|nr:cyclic nucleotide-binding domain-containing protein [Pseudomonadota bacterium]
MTDMVPNKQPFGVRQEIFRQGDPPRDAYLIERGRVEISRLNGDQKVIVGYKQTGDIFGEMALIDHAPRMATATAVEPTVCVVITESLFKEHLGKATPMLKKILTTFTGNLRTMSERASGLPADHS